MYKPNWTNIPDKKLIVSVIQKYDFATIIATKDNSIEISHLPLLAILENDDSFDDMVLVGHAAAGNPLLSCFDNKSKITVIFHGPHHYISPTWYKSEGVPTWNYITIHCLGTGKIIEYSDAEKNFDKLTEYYEKSYGSEWNKSSISKERLTKALGKICHFSIKVDKVDGKFKMSQNKNIDTRKSVISKLENIGSDNSSQVAEYMKVLLNHDNS